jgi:DNA topoisomerase-1
MIGAGNVFFCLYFFVVNDLQCMKSLEYAGPVFPEPYKYKAIFEVNGHKLSPLAEEMLFALSKHYGGDYWDKIIKWKNFWRDLEPHLNFSAKFPEDFVPTLIKMREYSEQEKAAKSLIKDQIKLEKERLKKTHGFALVDGNVVEVQSFVVESPSILLTRGEDPRFGSWKYRVNPKDVVLNCVNSKVPSNWEGQVASEPNVLWVAKYQINCTGFCLPKTVLLSQSSNIRQNRTENKYDKTENILANWTKIQKAIEDGIDSIDSTTSQSALVCYLIQQTGIRIGNVRTQLQADTRGASTLRKENISFPKNNIIHLSFLGKDSVPYDNDVVVSNKVWKKLKALVKNKSDSDQIFPKASAATVTSFLNNIVEGTTPKNLRTVVCNLTLIEELKKKNVQKTDKESEKIRAMFEANLAIAKTLNHQKNVSKTFNQSKQKAVDSLIESEQKLEERTKVIRQKIEYLENKKNKLSNNRELIQMIDGEILEQQQRLYKLNENIEKKRLALHKKDLTKDINLSTSLASYADFRVINSWCKDVDLSIDKIYTKAALKNFEWGLDVDENYWKNYAKGDDIECLQHKNI